MLPRKNYFRHVYGKRGSGVTSDGHRTHNSLNQKKLTIPDTRLKSILEQFPKD